MLTMEMGSFFDGGKEKEQGLLEILRSSGDIAEIKKTCLSLTVSETIYSLPVLAARMADTTKEMEEFFRQTTEMILIKHNVPKEHWSYFSDPDQWKPRWSSTPESFLAFVEMFSVTMTSEAKTGEMTDRLGEIFMKVIEVDLSPYQSFQELRICSTGNHLEELVERIHDQLQSQVMVYDLLDDVSIDYLKIEIDEKLYETLKTDYFTTRMRQYLKFADE